MSAHLYFSNLNKAVCYNMKLENVSYSNLVISEKTNKRFWESYYLEVCWKNEVVITWLFISSKIMKVFFYLLNIIQRKLFKKLIRQEPEIYLIKKIMNLKKGGYGQLHNSLVSRKAAPWTGASVFILQRLIFLIWHSILF